MAIDDACRHPFVLPTAAPWISSFPAQPEECMQVCGPPPMMKALSGDKAEDKSQGPLKGVLKDVGFTKSQVFKF